jgi:hypothetical protein
MLKTSKLNFRFIRSVTCSSRTKRPNIALSGGEVSFVGIVGRNGTPQGVGRQQRNGEASGVQRGETGSCAPARCHFRLAHRPAELWQRAWWLVPLWRPTAPASPLGRELRAAVRSFLVSDERAPWSGSPPSVHLFKQFQNKCGYDIGSGYKAQGLFRLQNEDAKMPFRFEWLFSCLQ